MEVFRNNGRKDLKTLVDFVLTENRKTKGDSQWCSGKRSNDRKK